MKHYALTGGIGSGKTTVLSVFNELGVPTFSADDSAKFAMQHNTILVQQIKALLGPKAYHKGVLNRAYIAKQVFNNPERLASLNAIVHPAATDAYLNWKNTQDAPYTMYEFPIVFELDAQQRFDGIVLVTAPEKERISRVMLRDDVTKDDVLDRIANQWNDTKKNPLADFVIENSDFSTVKSQVKALHKQLLKSSEA